MKRALNGIKVYKWTVLVLTLLGGALLGYVFVGPFLTSGVLEWVKEQPPIVGYLLSVESMINDSLISACVPMFLLWSISFYSYSSFKNKLDSVNEIIPLAWLFARSPATLVLFLSSILVGICIYGWVGYRHSSSLLALSILSACFIVIGFVLRASCTPKIKENKFLNKYSRVTAHVCVALTLAAYLWGIFADPISLYLLIQESMENG